MTTCDECGLTYPEDNCMNECGLCGILICHNCENYISEMDVRKGNSYCVDCEQVAIEERDSNFCHVCRSTVPPPHARGFTSAWCLERNLTVCSHRCALVAGENRER